jgi:CxC2 like cysteine cluster associated with KDZ transposases
MRQGDDDTADGYIGRIVTEQTHQGLVDTVEREPVWLNQALDETSTADAPPDLPDVMPFEENIYPGPHDEILTSTNRKTQQYYLQEFINRVDSMLNALLSREAIPRLEGCMRCKDAIPRWRCRDCTVQELLCRGCMRETHRVNPLHRIEVWMGDHFRAAELWEVGVYILVSHHQGTGMCNVLDVESTILERFQVVHDGQEQDRLNEGHPFQHPDGRPWEQRLREDSQGLRDDRGDVQDDLVGEESGDDAEFTRTLDQMYRDISSTTQTPAGTNADAWEDHEEDPEDNDLPELNLPRDYMPWDPTAGERLHHPAPRNAFDHPYIRVVHINGIHHIACLVCGCHGEENKHADVMAAGLIPTSFTRYRTMFTHKVLDDFRLTNLECKASAYQYFQKIRRLTSPMSLDSVPNLYHELRRLSRLWRWMKKLKWAGLGNKKDSDRNLGDLPAGSLANFCPACPQVNVNMPSNWMDNAEESWVYRRSFVGDGNFKADHVRQRNPAGDIWLSEGGGMMSKRADYEEFLRTAVERSTVSESCRPRAAR